MYVTRPLSMYKRNPSALSSAPPEGSNSGILIIQDEEVDLVVFAAPRSILSKTCLSRRTRI